MLEVIPSKVAPSDADDLIRLVGRVYDIGLHPDWWKLEAMPADDWARVARAIDARDPNLRGIVMLGLDAPIEAMEDAFAQAAGTSLVKGFAVGRTIFGEAARGWMAGAIDDAEAVRLMCARYARLCDAWDAARAAAAGGLARDEHELQPVCREGPVEGRAPSREGYAVGHQRLEVHRARADQPHRRSHDRGLEAKPEVMVSSL